MFSEGWHLPPPALIAKVRNTVAANAEVHSILGPDSFEFLVNQRAQTKGVAARSLAQRKRRLPPRLHVWDSGTKNPADIPRRNVKILRALGLCLTPHIMT
jgi:hypothetical protein